MLFTDSTLSKDDEYQGTRPCSRTPPSTMLRLTVQLVRPFWCDVRPAYLSRMQAPWPRRSRKTNIDVVIDIRHCGIWSTRSLAKSLYDAQSRLRCMSLRVVTRTEQVGVNQSICRNDQKRSSIRRFGRHPGRRALHSSRQQSLGRLRRDTQADKRVLA